MHPSAINNDKTIFIKTYYSNSSAPQTPSIQITLTPTHPAPGGRSPSTPPAPASTTPLPPPHSSLSSTTPPAHTPSAAAPPANIFPNYAHSPTHNPFPTSAYQNTYPPAYPSQNSPFAPPAPRPQPAHATSIPQSYQTATETSPIFPTPSPSIPLSR